MHLALPQGSGQVIAGLAARGAHAEVTPAPFSQCLLDIGPETEVLAHKAVGTTPIAGSQHMTVAIEHVDAEGARTTAQLLQIEIGARLQSFVVRRLQQRQDLGLQGHYIGEKGKFVDLAPQAGSIEIEAVVAGSHHGLETDLDKALIAQPAPQAACSQPEQDQQSSTQARRQES